MKPFIIGVATLLFSIMVYSFTHDFMQNKYYYKDLKYVCEESSIAGSLFINTNDYRDGRIVFNQSEALKAIDEQIKGMIRLDNSLQPLINSYWVDKIIYKTYFLDDSNTTYPYTFIDPDTNFTKSVVGPTIVVTINAGKARYNLPLFKNNANNIRSSAHTWEGRR